MNCPHCGVSAPDGTRMCSSCGRTMNSRPEFLRKTAAPEAPPVTQSIPRATPAKPASRTRTTVVDGARPEIEAALSILADFMPPPPQPQPAAPEPPPAAPTTIAPHEEDLSPPTVVEIPEATAAFCRVCHDGFEQIEGAADPTVCPTCREKAPPPPAADADARPVKVRPAHPDRPRPEPRRERSKRRLAPLESTKSYVGVAMSAAALAVCLAGVALVVSRRDSEPTSRYLDDVSSETARFVVAPPHDAATRIDTTLSLTIVHQGTLEAVSTRLEDLLRIEQRSTQTAEIVWARDVPSGVEIDSSAECRLAAQSGTSPEGDAKTLRAYPWDEFHGAVRVLVPESGVSSAVGGETLVVGRDVPACLTLRDVGAPSGEVSAGASWRARIILPLLATRDGAVFPAGFPCEVKYVGRREINHASAYAISVAGKAPTVVPTELDGMNQISGTLHAALFFDVDSGLLVEAHATIDAEVWRGEDRVEDRVRVNGKLDARRR
jgi:hypothetical protein